MSLPLFLKEKSKYDINSFRLLLECSWSILMTYAMLYMAMRFELATRRVTLPDSDIFTPFELQVNFTQKMLALPYQKYTFSERKFDEEFKYGFENEV